MNLLGGCWSSLRLLRIIGQGMHQFLLAVVGLDPAAVQGYFIRNVLIIHLYNMLVCILFLRTDIGQEYVKESCEGMLV